MSKKAKKAKIVRKGGHFYMGQKQYDLNSFMPHLGMAILVITVIAGSFFDRTGYFSSYASLQKSILTPSEVKVIALSLDKYTPFVDERDSEFIQSLEGGDLVSTGDQGYIDQPKVLLATESIQSRGDDVERGDLIVHYTVRAGDTVSSIASKYGINVNTLRWANQISNLDYVRPGQKIIVPRKNGVWYTVQGGESLSQIISKFGGNLKKTIEFNGLGKGNEIYKNQKILVLGGKKAAATPSTSSVASSTPSYRSTGSSESSGYRSRRASGSSYNRFPYGWCTWYVASRRNVPWSGNAGAWLYNARAMGYSTGSRPAPGAIMVSGESPVGHVALVEAVYGNSIKISEMNFRGWGIVSTRVIPANSGVVWGYIY